MDFEKKYPITQQPGDFILAQWTRGYKQVELYYQDQLIGSVQSSASLKKGTQITGTVLGTIGLKLSEKPVMLDVIVDGYHSPVNIGHPVKELKRLSTFFWILAVLSLIAGSLEASAFRNFPDFQKIVWLINALVICTYIVAAVYIKSGKAWGYYLGFSMFAFVTTVTLLILAGGLMWGFLLYMLQGFRFVGLGLLIYNLRIANSARRHQKYGQYKDVELLDSKL